MNAPLEGRAGCPYRNDFKRYPNITERDQEGTLLPSTAKKISQSENVRTRVFRSVEEREDYIRMMVCKREGLYTFYKLWIAARILDVTKDEMKLLVKDRVHPVGDIIFRCFALAFNCKYISFVRAWQEWLHGQRERHHLGHRPEQVRHASAGLVPSERALVARGSQQEVCPGTRSPEELGRGVPSTYSQAVHWGQVCVVKMLIAARCGLVPIRCLHLIDTIAMERLYIMIRIRVSKMTECVRGCIFR